MDTNDSVGPDADSERMARSTEHALKRDTTCWTVSCWNYGRSTYFCQEDHG